MTYSKELYKSLSVDFKTEDNFYFADRGEGMLQGWEKGSGRIFLVNRKKKEAWELISSNGRFSFWDASAVEIASAFDLPYKSQRNAVELHTPYYFGINEFKDGVANVSWTLQPDGRYYADEDGFGMEDDEEINFYAFIDTQANILIPFQPMDDTLMAQYRNQAVIMAHNRDEIPYICLSPEMTIPLSENIRIENNRDKLLKIIYGMMVQFGSQAENACKHNEYDGRFGIFTSINPTPDNYLSLSLLGKKSASDNEKYEVSIITALFKKGQEPQGIGMIMGEYLTNEIADAMIIEDNAEAIYNEFIQMVKDLYEL